MKPRNYILLALLFPILLFSQSVDLDVFATGFSRPVDIKHAGDSRLFIVEQDGVIKILNASGVTNPTAFLDIDARVRSTANEQGLLGLAFDPNYATNNRFYVNYINLSGDTVIARFTTSANPDVADDTSEEILLTVSQPYDNHNGGSLAFGTDGYLYIALGDGGSGGDPQNYAQNLQSHLGKILRIDVSGATSFTVPATNPFVGNPAGLDEIWSYGLRNPWKMSFDSNNGELWIGDVGQNNKEEINNVPIVNAGYNFGWRCYEGNSTFNTSGCPAMSTITFPVGEYNYGGNPFKCSITGGYRYRGNLYPDLEGAYFFADYCTNEVGTLKFSGGTWNMLFHGPFTGNIATFGEDSSKELYAAGLTNGIVYKVFDPTLGVEENSLSNQYQLYPNPAQNYFQINNQNAASQIKEVVMYSFSGKLVSTTSITTENQKIMTDQLSKGIYIVQLISNNDTVSYHKLVKN
ncbi:PQQ-dependent sugar dehydrogenase [Kordia sp. YSTF-M3]|uniref:PQQ-dependent sugar dehydrogenase n=1 Tax=Kordia aestuariivivens TaxID=2759037 RepID=A0ABR7QC16_9FLAO|nr:PQQ-dependent sugar dehydrogenase [Kordia aestuariivivens]MBC8756117.1 PQQ-dependent sugar dehydrogenase [Kordia aestuariivivens]